MRLQSAIGTAVTTITTTITVAAGVFAPGHPGELTWQIPFELADAVLEETRARERRLRELPSRVGVYFVLALGLFPALGYQNVWQKLTAALGELGLPDPTPKALRDLRRRIGIAAVKALFEVLAGPVAQPSAPGVRSGRFRTVAFDGCASVKVPDTRRNRAWLGKLKAALGVTGYPAVELMTLVETGTRALTGAVSGPRAPGETACARQLLHLLGPDMLVLTDRGFDAAAFLEAVAATKARFLARLTATRRLPVMARLDDGTFLSRIGELTVRVIEAEVIVTLADGTRYCGRCRLATTLPDHRRYPAAALIRLYTSAGTRGRLPGAAAHPAARTRPALGRPGRAGTGDTGAADPVPGAAPGNGHRRPDRPGHGPRPGQLHHRPANRHRYRDRSRRRGHQRPPAPRPHRPRGPGRLLPPRRPRVSVRKVKSPLSRWNKADPHRPVRSTPVTAMGITVHHPDAPETATRRQQCLTAAPGP